MIAVVEAGLIGPLISILSNGDFKTQKEACWAISNATTCLVQRSDVMATVVQMGVIPPLCDMLVCSDPKIIQVALDALDNILKTGDYDRGQAGFNPYVHLVEEARGIDRLNELQTHASPEIFQKAYRLLESYFGEEQMDDDMGGQVDATGNFAFDSSMPQDGFRF